MSYSISQNPAYTIAFDHTMRTSWSPLGRAVMMDEIDLVSELSQVRRYLDMRMDGKTPLLLAVILNRVEHVKVLVAEGADLETAGSFNRSALFLAVGKGFIEIAEILLKAGANPNAPDDRGIYPLDKALEQGFDDIAIMLLQKGAKCTADIPEHLEKYKQDGLHKAIDSGRFLLMEELIRFGVDLDYCDQDGNTPILLATLQGKVQAVRALVEGGADLQSDPSGTALHRAAEINSFAIAKILLDAGADPNALCDGNTPLDIAIRERHDKLAKLLIRNGAKSQGEIPKRLFKRRINLKTQVAWAIFAG